MRFFLSAVFLGLISTVSLPVTLGHAQEPQLEDPILPEPEQPDAQAVLPDIDDVPLVDEAIVSEAAERLDNLFADLKKTRNRRAAKRLADEIWGQWFKSGSASTDLMMHWSNEAARDQRFNIALDFLDQIVTRQPEFAEGWNRRATLHYTMSNFNKSMADINKVLELEPRHFGALSGLATILERTGKKEAALKAWQRALSVYPAMPSGQEALIRLSEELEGDPA